MSRTASEFPEQWPEEWQSTLLPILARQFDPDRPKKDAVRVMFAALVKIATAEAFFDGERELVMIARDAIREVVRP